MPPKPANELPNVGASATAWARERATTWLAIRIFPLSLVTVTFASLEMLQPYFVPEWPRNIFILCAIANGGLFGVKLTGALKN